MPSPTPPPLEDSTPRTVGPYRILGPIGAGSTGVVYAGLDRSGARVAVKVLHGEVAADPGFRARFTREIELMCRVRATRLSPVLAAGTGAERLWYATSYVPGLALSDHVEEHGPLLPAQSRALALALAEVLGAGHARGVTRLGLKPAGVILAPDGPKVVLSPAGRWAEVSALAARGAAPGGDGPKADILAWGTIVAFACTGRHPFGGDGGESTTRRAFGEEHDLRGVSPELRDLVARSLSADPDLRPDGAALFHRLAVQDREDRPASDPETVVAGAVRRGWAGARGTGERSRADWSAALRGARRRRGGRCLLAVGGVVAALLLAAGTGTVAVLSHQSGGQILARGDPEGGAAPAVGGYVPGFPADSQILADFGCDECVSPAETFTGLEHDGEPARVIVAESIQRHPLSGERAHHLLVFLVRDSDDEILAHNYETEQLNGMALDRDVPMEESYFVDPANRFGLTAELGPVEGEDSTLNVDYGNQISVFDADDLEQVERFGDPLSSIMTSSGPVLADDMDGDGGYEVGGEQRIDTATWLRTYWKWDTDVAGYRPWRCAESVDGGATYTESAPLDEEPCAAYGNAAAGS